MLRSGEAPIIGKHALPPGRKEAASRAQSIRSNFPGLDVLATCVEPIAAAIAVENRDGRPDVDRWLARVDQCLRGSDGINDVVALAQAIDRLRKSEHWPPFLEGLVDDARIATARREQKRQLRSLWGTTPINSLPISVAADRRLGISAESLVFSTYYITSNFDICLSRHIDAVRASGNDTETAFYYLVLIWAMLSFDIFFYFFDRGILPAAEFTGRLSMGINREELSLLRRAEKYLYVIPYGADYRTRRSTMALSRFNFCMDCPEIGRFCFCNDDIWPIVFQTTAAHATAVLAAGLALTQLKGARRFDYVVVDVDNIDPVYPEPKPKGKINLLHVPNHPHFKGTRYLTEAVDRISATANVQFTFASGISNSEVMQLMREADIVIDQLIGGYFGVTTLEAMALGKPVIVYIGDWDRVVNSAECPIINANPDTISEVLSGLLAEPARLTEIGKRSRRYVEQNYSVPALVGRLRELYAETAGIRLSAQMPDASSGRVKKITG